jgi:hypothetical protein
VDLMITFWLDNLQVTECAVDEDLLRLWAWQRDRGEVHVIIHFGDENFVKAIVLVHEQHPRKR